MSTSFFADEWNPTSEEIRAWAYSNALEPYEDFDILIAEPAHVATLICLASDPSCPSRSYILGSLYCLVGHSDLGDPRLSAAVDEALASADPMVKTWAKRSRRVIDEPGARTRNEWCGLDGLRTRPVED